MYSAVAANTDAYKDILEKIDKIYVKQVNKEYEKYLFQKINQGRDETFEAFVNRVRMGVVNCGYADKDSEIKSRIIQGCYFDVLRREAFQGNWDLEKLISNGRSSEINKYQSKEMVEQKHDSISAINYNNPSTHSKPISKSKSNNYLFVNKNEKKGEVKPLITPCTFCGRKHQRGKQHCPAFGRKCNKCGRLNHFANVCTSKAVSGETKQIHHNVMNV